MTTSSNHTLPARHRGTRRGSVTRWLTSLLMVLGLWLGVAGSASATSGRPTGWDVAHATEVVRVGRLELRYEADLAEPAQMLAERAPGWWAEIEEELAGDVDDDLQITFVEHSGRVAEASGMPHWAAGVAHPPSGEIIIARHAPDGSPTNLEELLRHEMTHVILHRATGGEELPRWFHEGVAESIANEVDLLRAEALAGAVFGVGVPPITELEAAFHGDARQASVAYAAARDFATWLRYHDVDGSQFRQLFSQLRMGRGFDTAVADAYGENLTELDEQWRAGLFGRFVWFPLLGSGELPFLLLGPVIGYAWWRRRQQMAAAWARLEAEDEADRMRILDVGMPA
jgi:hypothetical protein